MCSFVAHPCLVWEKNTVVAKVTKTFPMLDALTKAHILFFFFFFFLRYKGWRTDTANQGHSGVSFRLHGTKIRWRRRRRLLRTCPPRSSLFKRHENIRIRHGKQTFVRCNKQTHRASTPIKVNRVSWILRRRRHGDLHRSSARKQLEVKISEGPLTETNRIQEHPAP